MPVHPKWCRKSPASVPEMLDICGAHNITADVEFIPIQRINEAYERLDNFDAKYRYGIGIVEGVASGKTSNINARSAVFERAFRLIGWAEIYRP